MFKMRLHLEKCKRETGSVSLLQELQMEFKKRGGGEMKGNIYHDGFEMSVELIKFRITELEKEEKEQKDAHLPYQVLLKFFYDVRAIINE
jgi:hypothetical protein